MLGAQRNRDPLCFVQDVAAAGPSERGGDLLLGELGCGGRVGGSSQQFQRVRGGQVVEGFQRGRKELP